MRRASTTTKAVVTAHFASLFAGGTLRIYSGAQPIIADDPPQGDLLAVADVGAFESEWPATPTVAGRAGWFRLSSADGLLSLDGAISEQTGGGEMIVDNAALESGGTVRVLGFTLETKEEN